MTASHEMAVFCRVIEAGSFAGAAVELGLSPSAVSKIISRTEDRLGVRLLTRTTRKLALSAEGETYLNHARNVLSAIEAAEADVMQSSKSPSGRLRISSATTYARHQLVKILPEFLAKYPNITIELNVSDRMVDLLAEQVDVAIRAGKLADSSLIVRNIAQSSRVICASPAYIAANGKPEVPGDLAQHNCLLLTGSSNLQHWSFATPEGINRLRVHGDFASDSADVLHAMALDGHGIIRLARLVVDRDLATGTLVALLEKEHVQDIFPISALMQPGRYRAPRVKAFVDFLVEKFGNTPLD